MLSPNRASKRIKNAQTAKARRKPPSSVFYHPGLEANVEQKIWTNRKGDNHRLFDLPAVIFYYPNGVVQEKGYFRKGRYHRTGDKPAKITYSPKGKITGQWWFRKGSYHRDGGKPAIILSSDTGYSEYWYKNGINHNIQGPAVIEYTPRRKKILRKTYVVDGKDIAEEKFLLKEASRAFDVIGPQLSRKLPSELVSKVFQTLYKKKSPSKTVGGYMTKQLVAVPTINATGDRTGTKYVEKQLYVKKIRK